VVAKRSVENGEHVARGADMFTVVRSDVLELAAAVPARQASEISVGQQVHFRRRRAYLDGRVARINPSIDPTNRSVTVYTQVPNGAGAMMANRSPPAASCPGPSRALSSIPTSAIRQAQGTDKPFVYRLDANDALERAPSASGSWTRPGSRRRSSKASTPATDCRRQRRHARRRHEGDDRRRR
jgi:multidrug efflux pump subunit AcrA (membrane-fusion protein)